MGKIFSANAASVIFLIAMFGLIFFHLAVMAGLVPTEIIWGGRAAETGLSLMTLEAIALSIISVFILFVLAKRRNLRTGNNSGLINFGMWLIFALFALNTLGNLAALSSTETLLFTPVTIILALCGLRLALAR